jgi:uncharacterized phage protein gp47/JayE
MAIDTTTIKGISDGIVSQLEQSLNVQFPLLPKAFNRVLAKAIASVFIMLTHYSNFIQLQQYVSTCSANNITILGFTINPLNFWGDLIGVGDRKAGERAIHTVTVTVSQTSGVIDAGTQLISATNGFTYITSQAYNLTAPSIDIEVKAANDEAGNAGVGALGNLENGTEISFVNPPVNVGKNAVVIGQVQTGADPETADAYRRRVITAFKRRKQGGAYIDYKIWGEEVPGIVNVYPYTGQAGEVDVYCEATEASSGNPDGIPTPSQLEAVKASIEFDQNGKATRRPAGTFVNTYAITRTGFKVKVNGLVVDNIAQVQQEIERAVTEFFVAAEPYIEGLSVPPRTDTISTVEVEAVIVDVVKANNGTFLNAQVSLADDTPVSIYQLGIGEKAKLSEIAF